MQELLAVNTFFQRWADVTKMTKNSTMLVPESIRVSTREDSYVFSMFMNISETHHIMTQLANIAIRQLLDRENFEEDFSLSDRIAAASDTGIAGTSKRRKKKKVITTTVLFFGVHYLCVILWFFCFMYFLSLLY